MAHHCLFHWHVSGFKYKMVEAEVEELEYNDMCVRGCHIYQDVWRPWPLIGEELRCQRKEDTDIRGPYHRYYILRTQCIVYIVSMALRCYRNKTTCWYCRTCDMRRVDYGLQQGVCFVNCLWLPITKEHWLYWKYSCFIIWFEIIKVIIWIYNSFFLKRLAVLLGMFISWVAYIMSLHFVATVFIALMYHSL